jgi:transcriptional regulator with XRE-family HTH domain
MDDVRTSVGKRISYLRNKLGYTQEQLCEYADISQNYLSLLENGKKNCSIDTLAKIAEALRTTPPYFFISSKTQDDAKRDNHDEQIDAILSKLNKNEKKLILLTLRNFIRMKKKGN